MSKILANQIANYGDDSPIELKEGLNIPSDKPLQAAGVTGSNGQVLTSTGSTVQWTTPFDGNYNSLTNLPTIPAAQVNSDWNAVGTVSEILNKPLVPPLPSVTVTAVGSSSLSYNSTNGLFTYTPPDLSSFATSVDLSTAVANSSNWDTAYGWGDHSTEGYLTAEVDTLDTVTSRVGGATTANYIDIGGLYVGDNISITSSPHGQIQFRADSNGSDQGRIQGIEANLSIISGTTGHVSIGTYSIFYPDGNVILNNGGQGTTQFSNGFSVTGGSISGIDIEDLDNVDISGGLSDQQVLKWDSASSSWLPANDLVGGASGIALADLSVSTASAGSAALSYNNANGVFTFTPPDLSGYLTSVAINDVSDVNITSLADTEILRYNSTSGNWENWAPNYLTSYTETDPVFTASPANNITLTDINQWDTAYGWGNHADGGYLVATAQDKTNWNTAYGWGDHAQAGYLTSYTETDPVFTASDAAAVTAAKISNWDTAHGWGDHSAAGYQLTSSNSLGGLNNVTITNPSSNDVLSFDGSGWVNSVPTGGGANVTISDTAPGSAQAGDLWWESDKGRLKIYYNDTDSTQWVDASPPLSPTNVSETTTNGSNRVGVTSRTSQVQANEGAIEFQTDNGTTSAVRWVVTPYGSLIPTVNDTYDIGSAEYKVRDLYLGNNSLHTESGHSMSFEGGNLKWGGDDVIMLQDLKDMMATATSFEDFKNAIMGL
mgnify:CR=1 FL=1